jgi:inner membrane protein
MPTALTHALVGGALALAAPPDVPRGRVAVVAASLAVLPDLDVAAFALGIPYRDLLGHRGLSHSLLFAALCGIAAAWLLFPRLPRRRRWGLAGLFVLATASHGVLDACTDGGLGVAFFAPFSSRRSFLPWRPLVVSPIGVSAFFAGHAAPVLASELRWVWLPTLALVAAVVLWRRGRSTMSRRPEG